MAKKILFVGLLAITVVLAANIGLAIAQDDGSQETNETTTTVSASENPILLPSSKLYFLKDWRRKFQSVFAFSAQKKAELELRFSNEKLAEIKKMVEKAKSPENIEKATQKYQETMDKIANKIDGIKENVSSSPALKKFLNQVEKQQTLHQSILQKLESKVPTSTFEKIKSAREQHLEKFEQIKEKIQEKIGNRKLIGGDKDEYGCIGSAGYSWCDEKQKCIRVWEEECASSTTPTGDVCPALWKPVCSEKNETYPNECLAKIAGAKIKYQGICPESIGQ